MITQYELENITLANIFSKSRKIEKLENILDIPEELRKKVVKNILDGEKLEAVMSRAEDDDRQHWITLLGKKAAADLLSLGKVQPETMLEMSALSIEDFREVVKIATSTARSLNDITIEAERELVVNTIHPSIR
jgi:hypothetical protein